MSRFYDALRQASRFQQSENGRTTDGGPVFRVENIVPVPVLPEPARLDRPVDQAVLEPVATQVATPADDPWTISSAQRERNIPSGSLTGKTEVTLEKTARVIPNIADHAVVEHYRRLRTKLMQQHAVAPFRSLLVTSPGPQEGKSVTTLNLALSFSMLPNFRVAVFDGDLRRGSLGQWLGLRDKPGLSNLVEGTAGITDIVFKYADIPLYIVTRGTSTAPAAELLHSPALGQHLRGMAERFDLIILDSAPVNLITDTHILAESCDAVLFVARAFSTTCKAFEKAVEDLSSRRIVGTVLNGGTRAHTYGQYGYY